jgi:hypothetical protein
LLRTSYELQDRYELGGALWLWKENANDVNAAVFWGVYGPPFGRGVPQRRRLAFVSRAYPLAIAGRLSSFSYDAGRGTFDLRATARPVRYRARSRATLIWVPRRCHCRVVARGTRVQEFRSGSGSVEVYAYPRGGAYRVFTRPLRRARRR